MTFDAAFWWPEVGEVMVSLTDGGSTVTYDKEKHHPEDVSALGMLHDALRAKERSEKHGVAS